MTKKKKKKNNTNISSQHTNIPKETEVVLDCAIIL